MLDPSWTELQPARGAAIGLLDEQANRLRVHRDAISTLSRQGFLGLLGAANQSPGWRLGFTPSSSKTPINQVPPAVGKFQKAYQLPGGSCRRCKDEWRSVGYLLCYSSHQRRNDMVCEPCSLKESRDLRPQARPNFDAKRYVHIRANRLGMKPSPERPGRVRAKHTRSKLGCGVCRVRRIRCDQTRPACNRCSSTGRTCDGYPTPRPKTKSASTVSKPPVQITAKEPDATNPWKILVEPKGFGETEYRLFHFYANQTASAMDGYFEDDFWRRLVLQVSHRVPCVRNAVLALTCLHSIHCLEQPTSPSGPSMEIVTLRRQAIHYYTNTIQLLNDHISSNKWAYLEETLLCCVLCIRFEWIAGNRAKALIHLRSSIQILREWQTSSSSPSPTHTSFWSPGGYLIRSTISPLYVRLTLEASMFAEKWEAVPVPPRPLFLAASQAFTALKDARDSLFEILGDEHLFRRQRSGVWEEPEHSARELTTKERFNLWSISLTELLSRLDAETNATPAAITLRIWLKIVRIMLEISEANLNDECAFDRYTQDFSDAVDLASNIYSMKASTFLADTSVVAVLFYVATKCRHPQTRRRAIALLESSPRPEGIWHSTVAVRLASHVVEQEEMAAGCKVVSESDVPQAARLQAAVYVWEDWENFPSTRSSSSFD